MQIQREPALTAIALLAPAVQLGVAFIVRDPALQTAVNATAALLAGAATAYVVRSDRLAPAILGAAQALLALGIQLGWDPSAEQQAALMSFVGVVIAAYIRTQVYAVPARDALGVQWKADHEAGRHSVAVLPPPPQQVAPGQQFGWYDATDDPEEGL